MSLLEIRNKMFRAFLMIYSGTHLGMLIFLLTVARRGAYLSDLIGVLVITTLLCLLFLTFYSREELTGKWMFMRIGIHFVLNLVVLLSGATYFRWIIWTNDDAGRHLVTILCIFLIIYPIIAYLELREVRNLASELNQRLQERNKKKGQENKNKK